MDEIAQQLKAYIDTHPRPLKILCKRQSVTV